MQKLQYSECKKGGMHMGELVNFTCIEKTCCEARNILGCSVCMQTDHVACRTAPLKYLYKQLAEFAEVHKNGSSDHNQHGNSKSNGNIASISSKQAFDDSSDDSTSSSTTGNQANFGQKKNEDLQETLMNLILTNRHMVLESILQTTNALIEKIKNVQRLCVGIFDNIQKQALMKLSKDNEIEGLVEKIMYSTSTVSDLQELLYKIFDILPEDYLQFVKHTPIPAAAAATTAADGTATSTGNTTTTSSNSGSSSSSSNSSSNNNNKSTPISNDLVDLKENLSTLFSSIVQNVSQKNDIILTSLNQQEKYLSELHSDKAIVENLVGKKNLDLTFSSTDKHASVTLIKPNIVKSNPASSSNYKFALTNSSMPMNQVTKFAFRLQNIHSSNWIAIGVCLQKVIKSKGYSFGLNLGHGAYMISSNSGSWSHSEASNNNVVKSFGFSNNSIVECVFDPLEGFLSFQLKEQPSKKYKLQINKQTEDNDAYHPCVLFYYPNDEVELIYPYN